MYISQLIVNPGSDPNRLRPGRLWIRNVYRVHQRLSMAFPDAPRTDQDPQFLAPWRGDDFHDCHVPRDDRSGFLFRIEPTRPPRILIQSARQPDWDYAFGGAPFLLEDRPKVKTFHPRFPTGQTLRFRLRANPTVKRDSKRHGLLDPAAQLAWLERKAAGGAFKLRSVTVGRVSPIVSWRGNRDGQQRQTHLGVDFEGILEVTDPGRFLQTLAAGIGPAKGYGFGMLSVAPV